jgi:hypothetical protein
MLPLQRLHGINGSLDPRIALVSLTTAILAKAD